MSSAPDRWSSTEQIQWRAEIEGHGISSPVAVGNRVYVTTAIAGKRRTAPRLAADYFLGLVAVIGLPILLRCRRNLESAKSHRPPGPFSDFFRRVDFALFLLIGAIVLVVAILMAIGPQAIDVALSRARDLGVGLARALGRRHTNLSFIEWEEGTRHNIWIISSAMALTTLALIPLSYPRESVVRVGGAVGLLVGVVLAKAGVPWAPAYGPRFPPGALIVMYSPVVGLASWQLLAFLASRARSTRRAPSPPEGRRWAIGVPALLSCGLFVSPNFLQEREMVTRRVICLDAATGSRLWHTDLFATPPETKASVNSHATPTPVVRNGVIVAAYGPGMVAVNSQGGQPLWLKMFPTWIENSLYGSGSSLVADSEAVFVMNDREFHARQASRVSAYALKTGRELWSVAPEFAHDGYATPVIHDDGHQKLLIAATAKAVVAYDAERGTVVWTVETPASQPVPSPVIVGETLYLSGGKGGDGYTAAYRLRQSAAPRELWTSRQSAADVASPVLYQGRLFTISSGGIMVSYEAESGRVIWRRRLHAGRGVFYASLTAADDKVYAVRSDGTTYVIAVEDRFRLISESSLPEEVFASPGFANDCLLMRTVSAVYCIRRND